MNRSIKKSPYSAFQNLLNTVLPIQWIFHHFSLNMLPFFYSSFIVYIKKRVIRFCSFIRMKARIRNKFSKPYFVVWEFFQRVLKNIFVELEVYQFNSREHIFKIFYKLVFVVSFFFVFQMSLSICLIFFSIKFISVYSIIYFIFILLIWYNNFIINIKLLIKSDVDSNFKFQFNQIFSHLSCSSFYIFLSLSLFF